MGTTEQLRAQIDRSTQRLAQLRAKEMLAEQRSAARARRDSKRARTQRALQLGEFVMEAGAGEMTGAELVGALLSYRETVVSTGERERHRLRGAAHLTQKAAERATPHPN